MIPKRTLLRIERGMEPFAVRFGAKSTAGRWYYDGELPNELRGLAIPAGTTPALDALQTMLVQRGQALGASPEIDEPPAPNQSPDAALPRCPTCGRAMVLRNKTHSNDKFWGCLGYPACQKTLQVDVHERIESKPEDAELARAMETTVRFAMEQLGRRAGRWLNLPKVGLGGKSPYDDMATLQGCRRVYALIRKVCQ